MDFTDAIYNWLSNFLEGGRQTSVCSGSLIYVPFPPNNNEFNYILVMPFSKTSYFIIRFSRLGFIQFLKDRLERNLILKETKEVLYPDFYKEKAPDAVTK